LVNLSPCLRMQFSIRAFQGPTDGRTCEVVSAMSNILSVCALDQRIKGLKTEPRPISTPHVSLLHPP
jgi:hypothetical protein